MAEIELQAALAELGIPNSEEVATKAQGTKADTAVQPSQLSSALLEKVDKEVGKVLSTNDYTTAEKAKLAGIAAEATVNATDAQLRNRATHTGTQTASTISDLNSAIQAVVDGVPNEGVRVGFLGTSLVQQNEAATANKISHWNRGWISWARFFSFGRFYTPIWFDPTVYAGWEPSQAPGVSRFFNGLNGGVSGQTLELIEARKDFFVDHVDCDIVVVDAGTNDIGPLSKEEIHAGRLRIAEYYLSHGKKVILLPILSRSITSWAAASSNRRKAAWINQKTRAYCDSTPNVYFWDWNQPWVNSGNSNGEPFATYTADGIHFSTPGGVAVGESFAKFLERILPNPAPRVWSQDDIFHEVDNPLGNLVSNPFCLGTGGAIGTGVTGTVAQGMRVERSGSGTATAVASKEVSTDNGGEWQVITVTPGTTDTLFYFRASAADTPHKYPAGTWVQASLEVDIGAFEGWQYVQLYLKDNGTSGRIAYGMEGFDNGGYVRLPVRALNGQIVTPPIEIIGDVQTIRWRLEVSVAGNATGPGVLKVRKAELREVANPKTVVQYTPLT